MSRLISLSLGYEAIVDDSDYEWLSSFNWFYVGNRTFHYGARSLTKADRLIYGNHHTWRMHRMILDVRPGDPRIVDHRNGNGLDNRRENLRITDYKGNNRNRKQRSSCNNPFKGISFCKDTRRWTASCRTGGGRQWLGSFDTPEQAARAYDFFARQTFGEFDRAGAREEDLDVFHAMQAHVSQLQEKKK